MLSGLDLFSGIGGITLALRPWVRPIAYCENDRWAQACLLSRMYDGSLPNAPIWDDVSTLSKDIIGPEPIDIIYGGFPCQDISCAGLGAGLGGKRSGLFFEIARLVGELRPNFVFLENVPAITTRGLTEVCLALTALGYDCRWTIVSAREMGAPHLRERWFLLAHANGAGLQIAGTEPDQEGQHPEAAGASAFSLVQRGVWEEPASKFSGVDDGIPPKTHRIRALGNSVVPAQAREAFRRLCGL